MRRLFTIALLVVLLMPSVHATTYIVDMQVLVATGDSSPDGNGVFADEFYSPVLNNAGQVAFIAKLLATTNSDPIDDYGIYRADVTAVQAMVRGGEPSAAGNLLDLLAVRLATLARRNLMGLDRFGHVSFVTTDNKNEDAIYRAEDSQLVTLVQSGESNSLGSNINIGPAALAFLVNDEGQLAYQIQTTDDQFLIRTSQTSHEVLWAVGDILPGGGELAAFRSFSMNNGGAVAARLNIVAEDPTFGQFITDGVTSTKIMQTGEAAVDGLGSYTVGATRAPDINDVGEVAVVLAVDDILSDYTGLYYFDGVQLQERTRSGVESVEGTLAGIVGPPRLNNLGTVLYGAVYGAFNSTGLLLNDPGQEAELVSEISQFSDFGLDLQNFTGAVINNLGQGLILATGRFNFTNVTVLLFFDPAHGYARIAQTGQAFRGGVITSLEAAVPFSVLEASNDHKNAQNAINDLGQTAFRYTLDTGESGIALAEVEFAGDDLIFWDGFQF